MTTDAIPMSQWPSDHRYVIPVAPGPDVVTVTIDGKEVQAPARRAAHQGRAGARHLHPALLLARAHEAGRHVPHVPRRGRGHARACRSRARRRSPTAWSSTRRAPNVKSAQDGVLEFLLINHPLDCPVCDRGGECPLQDQTLAFGPGESRFVEEKRHFEKPIPISDLVLLDRERCIQCGRCTRFAAEIAGDPLIDFGGRGGYTEVITYPDEPFSSYFSGNTVQICPVGALTASAYRFRARPWDLQTVETSCETCAVGCRGALQSTSNRIVRLLGVDSEPVNQGWLCDKGRYGYEWVHSRRTRAHADGAHRNRELVEVSWPEALDAAPPGCSRASTAAARRRSRCSAAPRHQRGRLRVGALRQGRARHRQRRRAARRRPARRGRARPARARRSPTSTTRAASCSLGPDLKEELPVLHLRVRRAAVDLGVPVVEIAPHATGLTREAIRGVASRAGRGRRRSPRSWPVRSPATAPRRATVRSSSAVAALDGRDGDLVVVLGRQSLAESPDAVVAAAAALAGLPDVKFLSALRRGNVHGALDMGLTPGFAARTRRSMPPRARRRVGRPTRPAHSPRSPRRGDRHARAARRRPAVGLPRSWAGRTPRSTRSGS